MYRSGPSIDLRPSRSGVGGRLWLGPDRDRLRTELLAGGWTTTSADGMLARSWPTESDPALMFDDLRRVYVLAHSAQPRWLPAHPVAGKEWIDVLFEYALLIGFVVVMPAAIGAVVATMASGLIGAAAGVPYALAGAVTCTVVFAAILYWGDALEQRTGRALPIGWTEIIGPLVATVVATVLIAVLAGG